MASQAVHWHEGMFLRPHHFQASQRHLADLGRRNAKWDVHYNWGLHSIHLDEEALANHRLVIHALEARLRDGTPVVVPQDGTLEPLDVRAAFQETGKRSFLAYLAVPALYMGRRNASLERQRDCRYYQATLDCEDENTGGNPQAVPVRHLNLSLLAEHHDQTGFEVLPLVRIEKSAQAEGTPQIDVAFMPPLLSCDAWKPLTDGLLRTVCDRIEKKIDWLVQQISSQGITFDRHAPGDTLILRQLQQLNEAQSLLKIGLFVPGVHPLWAFTELSRVVGQLAIFGATRRTPDLPHYNHDDLGTCFALLKQQLDAQLDILVEPEYKERPFIGAALRMQVALEPSWFAESWQVFIGVQSLLEPEQCVTMLTKPGQLDMKVGSSDRVEALFRQGSSGLRFVHVAVPPQALPKIAGQVYFQVAWDPKDPEWQNVQKTLTLALRLNEKLLVGSIQNQRRLTVKAGIKNVTMQFTLYVLPVKK